jgi:hypothetical protein
VIVGRAVPTRPIYAASSRQRKGQLRLAFFFAQENTTPKGSFSPSEFVPTEWSTAAEKAEFGNTLLHFLDSGCPRELFRKKFYTRLSMTFGNIAHYNLEGFYETWFTADKARLGFVQKLLRWPCHGDPKFTFSDVEYAVQRAMRERNYLGRFDLGAAEELRTREMKDLERLEEKYRKPQQAAPAEEPAEADAPASEPAAISMNSASKSTSSNRTEKEPLWAIPFTTTASLNSRRR